MKITILTDNQNSWFIPYGYILSRQITAIGHDVKYVHRKEDLDSGDICFLLSCERLVDEQGLKLHRHNIVVHASDLPRGKGFAPMQWQVLEGMSEIVLTLFEAALGTDAGPYYLKSCLHFDGTELYDELREKLAGRIIEMCREYVRQSETLKATPQTGSETIYRRRTTKDDELDVNKTLAAQFNHLRISDNEHHPVYFRINGHKYILKIYHALPNSPCHREVQS